MGEERWEHLQLILEVYQFARDAAVAAAWLMAQDPYLKSEELGQTIDEVENLIKKHEAFEKAAAAQEERFAALERLTTLELVEAAKKGELTGAQRELLATGQTYSPSTHRRFELKELRRRQEEDEQRRREEISRHSAGADKTDGEKSEAGSIRSGGRSGSEPASAAAAVPLERKSSQPQKKPIETAAAAPAAPTQ